MQDLCKLPPLVESVAGQKYHYRLMRLLRNSLPQAVSRSDGFAHTLLLAAFIKSICIDFTGGLGASSFVACPFPGSSANVFMKSDIQFSRFF